MVQAALAAAGSWGAPPPPAAPLPLALPGPPPGSASWTAADVFAAGEAAGVARAAWCGPSLPVRAPPPPPPEGQAGVRPVVLRPAKDVREFEGKGRGKAGGWSGHQALPGPSSSGREAWRHEESEEEPDEMDHSGWPAREVQQSGHGGGSCSGYWQEAPACSPGQ